MKKYLVVFLIIIIGFLMLLTLGHKNDNTTPTPTLSPISYIPLSSPRTKGDRLLGIDITTSNTKDFNKSFDIAKDLGEQFVQLSIPWDEIEKEPHVLHNDFFAIADAYYPAHQTSVALNLNVIDTTTLRLPKDLINKKLDDTEVITRFEKVVDYALSCLPHVTIVSLSLGNEVDIYLNNHPEKWPEYIRFYNTIYSYIKSKNSALPIGVKMTFKGLASSNPNATDLNKKSDIILVTYYPITDNFKVQPPTIVEKDFKQIADSFSKPIYILETGYPSSELNDSSEQLQSSFIAQVFKAWDVHSARIKAVNFVWLHDLSKSVVKGYEGYYGSNSKAFGAYLETMGLITYSDSPKASYTALKTEAAARGW